MSVHTFGARWRLLYLLIAVLAPALAGCTGITVRPAQAPFLFEEWQASIGGNNDLSPRTQQTLRQQDLDQQFASKPTEAFTTLQAILVNNPQPDFVFALAEMSYLLGERSEKASSAEACVYYYLCAGYAYHYLFDTDTDRALETSFDPRFRLACDIYNAGLAKCIRAAQRAGRLDPREQLHLSTSEGSTFTLSVHHHGFPWPPDEFGTLLFCSDYQVVGLANHFRTYGLGVPLIGTRNSSAPSPGHAKYPKEVSFPVSAFFRFEGTLAELGARHCGRLELYNPLTVQTVVVNNRPVPLETDLTTPLAYFLSRSDLNDVPLEGFLAPDKLANRTGIYMFEPYQPGKIPVLFVHGLLSSPLTWAPMFNDLRADPELRKRCQFWFYLYPTGAPYLDTAADLRHALDGLRAELDPSNTDTALSDMVLVGHSMGGLVSRLMTIDGGDDFWGLVSKVPLSLYKGRASDKEELGELFYFEKLPQVRRVVFIGTPHHGSALSPSPIGRLAADLAELPGNLVNASRDLMRDNPHLLNQVLESSVDLLAPRSPAIEVLATRTRPATVQYHSIIGQAPFSSTLREVTFGLGLHEKRTDGVVPYTSAHLENVASEIVVRADHTHVHQHPISVLEVRRILYEHLREYEEANSATVRTKQGREEESYDGRITGN